MKEEPEGGANGGREVAEAKSGVREDAEGRVEIRIAGPADVKYVYPILREIEVSAKARGTGIAKRTPQSLCQNIYEGKAVRSE